MQYVQYIQSFLDEELLLNRLNYESGDDSEWEEKYAGFRLRYLSGQMQNYLFRVPVNAMSEDRRQKMLAFIARRNLYLETWYASAGKNMLNAFCSFHNVDSHDIRQVLVFEGLGNGIKLVALESICENCFGAGYLEPEKIFCSSCNGTGITITKTSYLVAWKTASHKPHPGHGCRITGMPASQMQVGLLQMQCGDIPQTGNFYPPPMPPRHY